MSAIDALSSAIKTLTENVRSERGVINSGIRDNDETRQAIDSLISGWAQVVAERDQLRARVAEIETADAGSSALNGFYCYMIEKTASIPIGAEDNQRGASTYNWYRHFAQMVWDYMDQRANKLEADNG